MFRSVLDRKKYVELKNALDIENMQKKTCFLLLFFEFFEKLKNDEIQQNYCINLDKRDNKYLTK